MRAVLIAAFVIAGAVGCAVVRPPSEPFIPLATVRQIMDAIITPSSDRVFAAAGETPSGDEQWIEIEHAALNLAESGNLLLISGRLPDNGEVWSTQAIDLIRAAGRAADAARNRDFEAISRAGDAIYETCIGCHQTYLSPLLEDL